MGRKVQSGPGIVLSFKLSLPLYDWSRRRRGEWKVERLGGGGGGGRRKEEAVRGGEERRGEE